MSQASMSSTVTSSQVDHWIDLFPGLAALNSDHLAIAREAVHFPELETGAIAYVQGQDCPNYLMCLDGKTRVFKTSSQGREILIYRVGSGGTCALTTQCLLAGGTFPAESVAESPVKLAAIPADTFRTLMAESPQFRAYVLDDYSQLLSSMIALVDEVAFASLEQRLARRLLAEADDEGTIKKTHQQLASDLASVREVISRHLSEWEKAGWIETARSSIRIVDRQALATYRDK